MNENDKVQYLHEASVHNVRAAEAFLPYLLEIVKPKSVLDVGCGIGTWLHVLHKAGAERILGIDGANVDINSLYISPENFISSDLRNKLILGEKFDLVISLEVAEHLPSHSAEDFIDTLISHGDIILFSAALPKQGGQNHLNEQSFEYWVRRFNDRGYTVLDPFRSVIWSHKQIDWWYRQNIFLVVRNGNPLVKSTKQIKINDYYHPELFFELSDERDSLKEALHNLYQNHQSLIDRQEMFLNGKLGVATAFKAFVSSLRIFLMKKR